MRSELNMLLQFAEQAQLRSREVKEHLTDLLVIGEQTLSVEQEAVEQLNLAKNAFERLDKPLLGFDSERLSA
ncbi:unnamed protein product [Arabis nemorensis]|uniref:Uncharacterized protein n=1 Tax=Arabis nemorensis TaxID=586526 RepID=A0A565BZJ0_9BRAS|nr:unnamed protein product [Arabis nemorensis]